MSPENEALLMREVGTITAKLDMLNESVKTIQPRITEVEKKINKHTGILTLAGSFCLFFKDRILGIIGT